jgi:hypothetical protein
MHNHPVTLRVPTLFEKKGRKKFFPLLPEEGWLRSRRGGGSLPEEGWLRSRRGGGSLPEEGCLRMQAGWWEAHEEGSAERPRVVWVAVTAA